MQADHARLLRGLLADLANVLLHLLLGFRDDLLDSRGMDSPVLNELLERDLGDLATDAVEPRHDHDARRVVDDHVNARGLLERADVSPLAADDPAFHFITGNIDRADGDLRGVRCRIPLDRRRQDLPRLLLAGITHCRLVSQHHRAELTAQLLFDLAQQGGPGFVGR